MLYNEFFYVNIEIIKIIINRRAFWKDIAR